MVGEALIGYYPTGLSDVTRPAKNIPLGNEWMGILDSVEVEQSMPCHRRITRRA
jgi:hypothetical protein